MVKKKKCSRDTAGYKVFTVFNYFLLALVGLLCLFPLVHVLALSLSSKQYVEANLVTFFPKGFTWDSYGYIFSGNEFWRALWISVQRTVLGTLLTTLFTIMLAYPLSKERTLFAGRNIYMGLLVVAMLFSGGLVPTYLLVANTLNLKDTIWALIFPCSIQVFLATMMMNFFRQLPHELEEAAYIDGADHFNVLIQITLPCSTPIIITVMIFTFISHWNSWFDGLIYSSQPMYYPLQTYLQQFLKEPALSSMTNTYTDVSYRTLASANIFIILLPVAIFYPWVQKYFIKGITLGSVKG